ncbi:unnamed protein product [Ilex paraguariensis]|uniref:Uncharacterized protein n=1 Tax=Ilex paraguariensis TaxID=185542 RepID=A0ABC8TCA0_9AQUA
MGSYNKEERHDGVIIRYKEFEKIVKAFIACLGSFLLSMIGGMMLGWWELRYHPTNSQLWMVPFGLILFVTPIIVWLSVFISDVCSSKEPNPSNQIKLSVVSPVIDPERDEQTLSK